MIRDKLKQKTLQNPGPFRFRGTDNTRIEALSDGVFALAFALLVISTSIPRTYSELIIFLDDLVPFAICIILLVTIWFQHYIFFIRYGFKDATIVAINTFLLILILFYIYPLKFLFQVLYYMFKAMVTQDQALITHLFTEILPLDKAPNLMIIYGIGASLIFLTLSIMYHIAYRRREHLVLTEIETFDTRASFVTNILMGIPPFCSVLISVFGPESNITFIVSGWIYFLYPVIMPVYGTLRAREKKKLLENLSTSKETGN